MFLHVKTFLFYFLSRLPLLLTHLLILLSHSILILAMYVPYFMLIVSMQETLLCCPVRIESCMLPIQLRVHDCSRI